MLALLFAVGALLISIVIGIGRQVTVFTALTPGLWLFHNYRRKRFIGLGLVVLLSVIALLMHPSSTVIALVSASGAPSLFALLFNLNHLFPSLRAVRAVKVDGNEAPEDLPNVDTQMLVVEIGGEKRAYPLDKMVMPRHLVHDVVGGLHIVITYCALCRTGLVFRAEHGGQKLFFEVVGVFRRNLLMEDLQTGTLWQQATGNAVYGPLSGSVLELLPSEQIPWMRAQMQSEMTLATDPEGSSFAILATRTGFKLLKQATERIMAPGHTRLSGVLSPRETVFGVQINGVSKAYPLSKLRSATPFSDTIGGVQVEVEFNEQTGVLHVHRRDGEADPIVEKHWWLGWNEFHPDTEVYHP